MLMATLKRINNGGKRARPLKPPARTRPRPLPLLVHALPVACGDYHTCAVLSSGTVQCWGRNDQGQLGAMASLPPAPLLPPSDFEPPVACEPPRAAVPPNEGTAPMLAACASASRSVRPPQLISHRAAHSNQNLRADIVRCDYSIRPVACPQLLGPDDPISAVLGSGS